MDSLIVITAGARGTTHTPSLKLLENQLNILKTASKSTFKKLNTIAVQHAASILLHKRKIENNQNIPFYISSSLKNHTKGIVAHTTFIAVNHLS